METPVIAAPAVVSEPFESAANKSHSIRRVLSWTLGIVLPLLIIVPLLLFHAYIAWHLSKPAIAALSSNPLQAVQLPYEDIAFASGNETLQGWYIPAAQTSRTVVFSHGYGGNREEAWVPLYDLAKSLHDRHFNVLMFDYGYVSDPHRFVTGGVRESQELRDAISFAKEKGATNVYIWGFSMGAGTALQAALGNEDINGMILDSTFLLTPDTLYANLKRHVDLPRFPSLPLIRMFASIWSGMTLNQIPYRQVVSTDFSIPLFLIHGQQDELAPYQTAEAIYAEQKQNDRTELWLLPNGRHELLYNSAKKEYTKRAFAFLRDIANG